MIDLQLLIHVPALEIGPVLFGGVERITEFHRFLSFSDDSCDFSDDSCHFCTPPPYFYVVNMSSIPRSLILESMVPGGITTWHHGFKYKTDTPFAELFIRSLHEATIAGHAGRSLGQTPRSSHFYGSATPPRDLPSPAHSNNSLISEVPYIPTDPKQ